MWECVFGSISAHTKCPNEKMICVLLEMLDGQRCVTI